MMNENDLCVPPWADGCTEDGLESKKYYCAWGICEEVGEIFLKKGDWGAYYRKPDGWERHGKWLVCKKHSAETKKYTDAAQIARREQYRLERERKQKGGDAQALLMEWDKKNPSPKLPKWASGRCPSESVMHIRRVICRGCGVVAEIARKENTPPRHPWENRANCWPTCPDCKDRLDKTWGVEYSEWMKCREPYVDAIRKAMGEKVSKTWWKESLKSLFGKNK